MLLEPVDSDDEDALEPRLPGHNFSRRGFLTAAVAAGGALLLGFSLPLRPVTPKPPPRPRTFRPMRSSASMAATT
jgi:hypothetical protein